MGNKEHFDAGEFVETLLKEGESVACDETSPDFNRNEVPDFYDEEKFQRGQKFFHKYVFSMFFGKMLGLLSVLAIPSILKILMHTKMSGTEFSAYKRYMATVLHMNIWYESDFKPGSLLWKSVLDVKSRHNSASKKCCAAGIHRINQKDMALTQFGFMGYVVTKPELVGVHGASKEDFESFIHLWKVIGYIMGIEDRFNICRDSWEETQAICLILMEKLFKPAVETKGAEHMEMSGYLINGMWVMNPILEQNVFLSYLYNLLCSSTTNNNNNTLAKNEYIVLNKVQVFHLWVLEITMYLLRYTIIRFYHNSVHYISLKIMATFPFLAVYKFGSPNAIVSILGNGQNKLK